MLIKIPENVGNLGNSYLIQIKSKNANNIPK
jgi:hypothetical protein